MCIVMTKYGIYENGGELKYCNHENISVQLLLQCNGFEES